MEFFIIAECCWDIKTRWQFSKNKIKYRTEYDRQNKQTKRRMNELKNLIAPYSVKIKFVTWLPNFHSYGEILYEWWVSSHVYYHRTIDDGILNGCIILLRLQNKNNVFKMHNTHN
jgi:hypothetical protein